MKKNLIFLITLVLLPIAGLAQSGTIEGYDISWSIEDGTLTVSGTGDLPGYEDAVPGYYYVPPWYNYREKITNAIIEEGITSIGNAFIECFALTSVTIPSGITSIEMYAFTGCSALTSIIIPENVTTIGDFAFCRCSALTSIIIPNKVTSIGQGVFEECLALTSIRIPSSVESIGRLAFLRSSKLTIIDVDVENQIYSSQDGVLYDKNVKRLIFYPPGRIGAFEIPYGVTTIEDAFFDCDNLTTVIIPNSVTIIGAGAFRDCDNLNSITIPNSVTYINGGGGAFGNCKSLTDINVNIDNKAYSSMNGVLYNKNKTILMCHPAGRENITFEIPEGVTIIDDDAFRGCENLISVTIPNGVTDIRWAAFYECKNLSSIRIPNSVTNIGNYVFRDCKSLKSIMIPYSVNSIGYNVFQFCNNLASIIVDANNTLYSSIDGVLYDKNQTVLRCYPAGKNNSTFEIPNSVTMIDHGAFEDCDNLISLTIPNSVTDIKIAFDYCDNLRDMRVFWSTPLVIGTDVIRCTVPHNQMTLYVPVGTKHLYEKADSWKEFGAIVEMEPTGIEPLQTNCTFAIIHESTLTVSSPLVEYVSVYSINGKLLFSKRKDSGNMTFSLDSIQEQILIVRGSSGWVQKVVKQ